MKNSLLSISRCGYVPSFVSFALVTTLSRQFHTQTYTRVQSKKLKKKTFLDQEQFCLFAFLRVTQKDCRLHCLSISSLSPLLLFFSLIFLFLYYFRSLHFVALSICRCVFYQPKKCFYRINFHRIRIVGAFCVDFMSLCACVRVMVFISFFCFILSFLGSCFFFVRFLSLSLDSNFNDSVVNIHTNELNIAFDVTVQKLQHSQSTYWFLFLSFVRRAQF